MRVRNYIRNLKEWKNQTKTRGPNGRVLETGEKKGYRLG